MAVYDCNRRMYRLLSVPSYVPGRRTVSVIKKIIIKYLLRFSPFRLIQKLGFEMCWDSLVESCIHVANPSRCRIILK